VQQAHHAVFVFKGAGLHNGADQDLNEAGADGVEDDGEQDAPQRDREEVRQKGQQHEPDSGQEL